MSSSEHGETVQPSAASSVVDIEYANMNGDWVANVTGPGDREAVVSHYSDGGWAMRVFLADGMSFTAYFNSDKTHHIIIEPRLDQMLFVTLDAGGKETIIVHGPGRLRMNLTGRPGIEEKTAKAFDVEGGDDVMRRGGNALTAIALVIEEATRLRAETTAQAAADAARFMALTTGTAAARADDTPPPPASTGTTDAV